MFCEYEKILVQSMVSKEAKLAFDKAIGAKRNHAKLALLTSSYSFSSNACWI